MNVGVRIADNKGNPSDFEPFRMGLGLLQAGRTDEIGGKYDLSIKVTGTISAGGIPVKTSQFGDGEDETTKATITAAGTYTITITDTDNWLYIGGDETLASDDVKAIIVLKKKNSVIELASAEDLPTDPSVLTNGTKFMLSELITGQGGDCVEIVVCGGAYKIVGGKSILFSGREYSVDTTGQTSTWVQVGTIKFPKALMNRNLYMDTLIECSIGGGTVGVRIGNRLISQTTGISSTVADYSPQVSHYDRILDIYKCIAFIEGAATYYTTSELQGTGTVTLPLYIFASVEKTVTIRNIEITI